MSNLVDIEKRVDGFRDALDEPVDPKIKKLVVALINAGFETSASCEGHLDHGCPYPWVDIKCDKNEVKRLRGLLREFKRLNKANAKFFLVDFNDYRLQPYRRLQADEKLKPNTVVLRQLQATADALADYLASKTPE